jgi:type IV secretory pathway protease TraF
MRSRTATILMTFAAVVLVLSTVGEATPAYIWNASKSVPVGLYQPKPVGRLAVTELVAVRPPEPLATFLDLNVICRSAFPCQARGTNEAIERAVREKRRFWH